MPCPERERGARIGAAGTEEPGGVGERPFPRPRMLAVPFKANAARRHRIPKQRHRVTNWAEYDASLRQRGSLTVWFTDEAIAAWRAAPRATRGPPAYSSLRHRFRNGPLGVKPLEQVSRRRVHASVRGRHDGRHTMPSGEEPTSQSLAAWFRPRGVGPPAVSRLRRFPRPGDGTSREQDGSVPLRSCPLRSRRLRLGGLPPEAELAAVHPQAV